MSLPNLVTNGIVSTMKWYEYVKTVAKHRGVTQDQIADAIGVTRGGVGHWLSGRREPPIETLKSILDFLDIDFNALFDDTEEHAVKEAIYDRELQELSSGLSAESKAKLKDMAELLSKAEQASSSD